MFRTDARVSLELPQGGNVAKGKKKPPVTGGRDGRFKKTPQSRGESGRSGSGHGEDQSDPGKPTLGRHTQVTCLRLEVPAPSLFCSSPSMTQGVVSWAVISLRAGFVPESSPETRFPPKSFAAKLNRRYHRSTLPSFSVNGVLENVTTLLFRA